MAFSGKIDYCTFQNLLISCLKAIEGGGSPSSSDDVREYTSVTVGY